MSKVTPPPPRETSAHGCRQGDATVHHSLGWNPTASLAEGRGGEAVGPGTVETPP